MPTTFLSVSMSEANAEGSQLTSELRARAPQVRPIAGPLLYAQYGVLIRFFMKQNECTDWIARGAFVKEIIAHLPR
jgi:hypothetical protein